MLHCKKCDYQTPKLKPSKAKQKLSAHEYSRHNKEDLPKAKLEAAENNPEEDCNNLPMVQFAAQKEVLHDILEITKAGTEFYDDVLDVEQVIFAQHKENLPEKRCILCGHSFPIIIDFWGKQEWYCPEECQFQDEEVEETNSNTS